VDAFEQFARGGLGWLGLEADDADLAIMRYIDEIYGPELRALLATDMRGWWPEKAFDPGRAPAPDDASEPQAPAA
jgi:hypothetical protein